LGENEFVFNYFRYITLSPCVNVVYNQYLLNSYSFTIMFINNSMYLRGNGKICVRVAVGT